MRFFPVDRVVCKKAQTVEKVSEKKMDKKYTASRYLAAAITKSASKQTYYTIQFFVDRGRVDDAYRAYGYFRWVDDVLDAGSGSQSNKIAFAHRHGHHVLDRHGGGRFDVVHLHPHPARDVAVQP